MLAVGSFLAFINVIIIILLLGKEFASVYILVKIRERGIGLSQKKIDEYMESLKLDQPVSIEEFKAAVKRSL